MVFLKISQNLQENTSARASFLITLQPEACNIFKKETLTKLFSCELYEILREHVFWSNNGCFCKMIMR